MEELNNFKFGFNIDRKSDIFVDGHLKKWTFSWLLGIQRSSLTILLPLALSIYKYFKWIEKNKAFRKVPCVNEISHYVM